jgi:hypothetical protein
MCVGKRCATDGEGQRVSGRCAPRLAGRRASRTLEGSGYSFVSDRTCAVHSFSEQGVQDHRSPFLNVLHVDVRPPVECGPTSITTPASSPTNSGNTRTHNHFLHCFSSRTHSHKPPINAYLSCQPKHPPLCPHLRPCPRAYTGYSMSVERPRQHPLAGRAI